MDKEDKLDSLFAEQLRLRNEIENTRGKMQGNFDGYRIFMFSTAIIHEAAELQRETNWKWWKTSKDISIEKCQEEAIDIWHFLIDLSIELGLTPDQIVTTYLKKHAENMKRQKEGY